MTENHTNYNGTTASTAPDASAVSAAPLRAGSRSRTLRLLHALIPARGSGWGEVRVQTWSVRSRHLSRRVTEMAPCIRLLFLCLERTRQVQRKAAWHQG
jgi:hypothetical protein